MLYNGVQHSSTGVTPNILFLGWEVPISGQPPLGPDDGTPNEIIEQMLRQTQKYKLVAGQNQIRAIRRNTTHNMGIPRKFEPCQLADGQDWNHSIGERAVRSPRTLSYIASSCCCIRVKGTENPMQTPNNYPSSLRKSKLQQETTPRVGFLSPPNLYYEEDWTHPLEDSPLKKLFTQEPQAQTGELLLSQEEYGQRELRSEVSQYHKNSCETEIQRLREIAGEPAKRRDHGKEAAVARSKVQARRQKAERREAESLRAQTIGGTSKPLSTVIHPCPFLRIFKEQRNPGLRIKACTPPTAIRWWRTQGPGLRQRRKDVMMNTETREVAKRIHCQKMQKDLIKPHERRPLCPPFPPSLTLNQPIMKQQPHKNQPDTRSLHFWQGERQRNLF